MKKHPHTLGLLSFCLIFVGVASVCVFFRYVLYCDDLIASIFFFLSPFLLLVSTIALLIVRTKRGHIGISAFLGQVLTERQKTLFNSYFLGIATFVIITASIYVSVYQYEAARIIPKDYGDPNDWKYSFFHFIWQLIYALPLALIFRKMELIKTSNAFLISSLAYLFGTVPFMYSFAKIIG